MAVLKLGPLSDDKPVKVSVELPAALYRDMQTYAALLSQENHQEIADPAKLIVPMLRRFIDSDRGFAKARRSQPKQRPIS